MKARCKICREYFVKLSFSHKICRREECAIAYAEQEAVKRQAKESKEERKKVEERRQKLKTRSDYIKECQIEFNAYIRTRDRNQPCISCGIPLAHETIGGGFDCGHYRSVGSAPQLRFHEANANGQCKKCNRYRSGMAVDYRIGLISRRGEYIVEELEKDQSSLKWSIEELIEMKKKFRQMKKELENYDK